MEAEESNLTANTPEARKDEGATPEEALEAIESYYDEVSDDQFAEDVRDACATIENGSTECRAHAEEENSGSRSSVLR